MLYLENFSVFLNSSASGTINRVNMSFRLKNKVWVENKIDHNQTAVILKIVCKVHDGLSLQLFPELANKIVLELEKDYMPMPYVIFMDSQLFFR